jgi:hypothetical protein
MFRDPVPEGHEPLSEAAGRYGTTANALRLLARRGRIGAVLVRHRVFVRLADYEALHAPRPYPPARRRAA